MRKLLVFPACVLALLASPARAETSRVPFNVPSGFRITASRQLAPGLTHATLERKDPPAVVNVAARAPSSDARFQVLLSNDAIAGPEPRRELTSSMCARVHCLAAVNADFFGEVASEPVGAVVTDDQLLRSPNARHHQLIEASDGTLSTGQMSWRGKLVPSDLQQLDLDGVNRPRDANDLVLYTPAEGPVTGQNRFGAELVLQTVRPQGPIVLGKTTLVRLVELRPEGDTPIPPDGAVLSGHGRGQRALEDLWSRVQAGTADPEALLRLDVTPDARESVGGSPILVRDGKRWFADDGRALYALRAPRSMAGWTRDGTLMLVTVDGRQSGYSAGMTMVEAADLMMGLGAVEAINFDGGGSTAFVVNGSVVNRPSDRMVRRNGSSVLVRSPNPGEKVVAYIERPVAIAVGFVGPRPATPLLGPLSGSPHVQLVSPLARAAGPGMKLGETGLDTSALVMVLAALGSAVLSTRLRRPQPISARHSA